LTALLGNCMFCLSEGIIPHLFTQTQYNIRPARPKPTWVDEDKNPPLTHPSMLSHIHIRTHSQLYLRRVWSVLQNTTFNLQNCLTKWLTYLFPWCTVFLPGHLSQNDLVSWPKLEHGISKTSMFSSIQTLDVKPGLTSWKCELIFKQLQHGNTAASSLCAHVQGVDAHCNLSVLC
jgi:hypothetical protein